MSQTSSTISRVPASTISEEAPAVLSPWREFAQAFLHNKGATLGLIFMVCMVLLAIFAPVVAPHSPIEQYRDAIAQPPAWQAGGSWKFILGTDEAGRDLLSRLIFGARTSLLVGMFSVLAALLPGVILGLLAAFFPKVIGAGIMRLMDIMMALPSLLLAVAIVAKDRKCSTSYIQRKLAIGYNKAARIVEMMEEQGVVSSASAATGRACSSSTASCTRPLSRSLTYNSAPAATSSSARA